MTITEKIKKSFGQSAKSYALHGDFQKEVSRYLVRVFISPKMPVPARVLDVGCGTGFTALETRDRWPDAAITAIDLAHPMSAETYKSGIRQVATADASSLPFADGSFDLVISSLALQWIADNDLLFRELSRVLTPGGYLVFSTLGPGTLAELQAAYDRACQECTGKPAVFKPLVGRETLIDTMTRAGFGDRFALFQSVTRTYDTVEALFRALKGTGASLPGRPDNPPRRDILRKTVELYMGNGGQVDATYELIYLSARAS